MDKKNCFDQVGDVNYQHNYRHLLTYQKENSRLQHVNLNKEVFMKNNFFLQRKKRDKGSFLKMGYGKIFLILLVGLISSIGLLAQETNCGDGIDNDGDGFIDCSDSDCQTNISCTTPITDCTFTEDTFSFMVSGNNEVGYVDEFILTDLNGIIQEISLTPNFSNIISGDYSLFHLNYHNTNTIIGNAIGQSISNISGDCFEVSEGLKIKVCPSSAVNCNLDISLWLEGAYQSDNNEMSTLLNDYQLLPGQNPSFFIGQETPAGQPYHAAPWNYNGQEGAVYDYNLTGTNNANYPTDVVDWVLISLRSTPDESTTLCQQAAWVLKDGNLMLPAGCDCSLTTGQEVYVVIQHRNHLPIMTPNPIPVNNDGVEFDFRSQQSFQTFLGDGQKQISPGVFAMFAANGDQISQLGARVDINASDESIWISQNSMGDFYLIGDFNMDGDVNSVDESLWLDGSGKSADVDFDN